LSRAIPAADGDLPRPGEVALSQLKFERHPPRDPCDNAKATASRLPTRTDPTGFSPPVVQSEALAAAKTVCQSDYLYSTAQKRPRATTALICGRRRESPGQPACAEGSVVAARGEAPKMSRRKALQRASVTGVCQSDFWTSQAESLSRGDSPLPGTKPPHRFQRAFVHARAFASVRRHRARIWGRAPWFARPVDSAGYCRVPIGWRCEWWHALRRYGHGSSTFAYRAHPTQRDGARV
jgi:hypothetical protein